MHNHRQSRFIILAAAVSSTLLLVACGTVNTVSTRTEKATTSVPYHTQVNDALADIFLKATDVRLVRTPGGVLKAQIDVANDGFRTRHFHYQVEWLDANGTLVESVLNNWRQAQVYSGGAVTLTALAPTPECTDFRLKVRENQ
jgi:uncharacterized protein YcfL